VALVNAVVLIVIAVLITFEAYQRFFLVSNVNGSLMLGVAAFGLLANALIAWWLAQSETANLNMRSALLHVVGDAAAAAGVLAAGAAIAITGVAQLDPIASVVVAVLICLGAWRIISETLAILMEATPAGLDMSEMMRAILRVQGVKDVHDLHVWSISNEMRALSCHVLMEDLRTSEISLTLTQLKDLLRDRFGVDHSTIEVECEGCVTDSAYCVVGDEHEAAAHDHGALAR